MTPWQEGFVKQCEARGVDPRAVAKFASEYARGQEAAKQKLAKRAEAAKKAFDSMTPYQQGFAVRCHQRGIPAEKVASFVMKKKAGKLTPALGYDAGAPAALNPEGRPTGDDVAAVQGALENAIHDVGQAHLEGELARQRGNTEEPDTRELFDPKKEKWNKVKGFAKDHAGAIAGGGAALTAALLAAYLLSRKKKKAKK